MYNKDGKLIFSDGKDGYFYYKYDGNKTTVSKGGNVVKEIETLDNGKNITHEYSYSKLGVREVTTTDENGIKTKTTEFLDDYMFNHASPGVGMTMKDLKEILDTKITSGTLHSFSYYGDRLVETLADMPDEFDKEKYITGVIDKLDEYAKLANVSTKEQDNINNDKISNSYYKSENSYTTYAANNTITVIDNSTSKKTAINITKMLKQFSAGEREALQGIIKNLPAECLMDLKTEAAFTNLPVDADTLGAYRIDSDTIRLRGGDYSRETLVHELGHAVDAKGKSGFYSDTDKAFVQAFTEEMKTYKAAGNIKFTITKSGTETWNEDESNYATYNRQEMFAECYAMLMLGDNQSAETIKKYFPKTFEAAKNLLAKIRQQPDNVRHRS